jgi:hypothetical protein
MHGDGNLTELSIVPAGHKKDVKAFLQIAPLHYFCTKVLSTRFEASGPELQASFLVAKSLFGNLTFSGHLPS